MIPRNFNIDQNAPVVRIPPNLLPQLAEWIPPLAWAWAWAMFETIMNIHYLKKMCSTVNSTFFKIVTKNLIYGEIELSGRHSLLYCDFLCDFYFFIKKILPGTSETSTVNFHPWWMQITEIKQTPTFCFYHVLLLSRFQLNKIFEKELEII